MPKISIIIPNYNTEKHLPKCLDSLVNQTFKDIEIIVIDDGSTDASAKIIRKYAAKDNRIKVITQKNSGPATARNKGLDAATGKYLMFCDSDDWYEPNMCEIMFKTIEKQKTDVVCCHPEVELAPNLTRTELQRFHHFEWYYFQKMRGRYNLTDKLILETNVLLWNKIWRHDIIKQHHIRFPDGHEHDDDAFWWLFGCVARDIYFIKKRLYHYYIRSGSIMSTQINKKPKNRFDSISVANYVFNFLFKANLIETYHDLMAKIFLDKLRYVYEKQFLTTKEAISVCLDFNKKIQNILGIEAKLVVYGQSDICLLYKKNRLRLTIEYITTSFYRKRYNRYKYLLWLTNKLEWRYNKELRSKNKITSL